jgi:hypothetical protein
MPTFEVGSGVTLEDGQYPATIKSIEPLDRSLQTQPSQFGDKAQSVITWKLDGEFFDAEDNPLEEMTRRQYVNDVGALRPKSNWYKIFSAVLNGNQPLDSAVAYNTDDLVGKPAVIFWGSYIGTDGTTKQKIQQVSPPRKAKANGAGAVRRKVADDDEQIDPDAAIGQL